MRLRGTKRERFKHFAGSPFTCSPVSQFCDFKSFLALFLIMDILEKLLYDEEWQSFLSYKKQKGHLSSSEEKALNEFINKKAYLTVANRLNCGGSFSVPEAVKINKSFSDKKRTVFVFPPEENTVQKMLAYQLLGYDSVFCDNLFSFRRELGVKKALFSIIGVPDIRLKYSYKLDISDYFNSVDAKLLLPQLKAVLSDEPRLYSLIENMLLNPYALVDGKKQEIKKGILAGSPVSGFLANLFLTELDRHFYKLGVPYARYSDDIILFADTPEELTAHTDYINQFLAEHSLSVNTEKVFTSAPCEKWTFLGFCYRDGIIDISEASKNKLKKKMRRKANALVRWKRKKNAEPERAVRAFIRHFNRKLFCNPIKNELTWARWYFPIINTDESLKELDAYMQQCMRYIATEKRSKAQFNFKYEQMKSLGYTTLVNSFYKSKGKDG